MVIKLTQMEYGYNNNLWEKGYVGMLALFCTCASRVIINGFYDIFSAYLIVLNQDMDIRDES